MTRPSLSRRQQEAVLLWLELSRCSGMLGRHMDGKLRKAHKQSMSRFDLLSQLERAPNRTLPVSQLASQLLASSGNITRLVDRMIKDGLITRQPSTEDRRRADITLTDEGLACFYRMATDHADWAQEALGELSTTQMRDARSQLTDVRNVLEKLDS